MKIAARTEVAIPASTRKARNDLDDGTTDAPRTHHGNGKLGEDSPEGGKRP